MTVPRLPLLCLILACGAAAAVAAPAVFEDTFTNTTGKARNIDVRDYEWASFVGPAGELNRAGTSIAAGPGQPAELPGYLAASTAPGQTRVLVRNLKGGLDLAGTTLSFRFGASHMRAEARLLVRIAGEWYATDTFFTSTANMPNGAAFAAADEPAVLKKFLFTPSPSAWRRFTLKPGAALELSSARLGAPLPSATITGIGFLLTNPHASWGASAFFDTLQVIRAAGP